VHNVRIVSDEEIEKLRARNKAKGVNSSQAEKSTELLKWRSFRNAEFPNIDLRNADLTATRFDGADLFAASLDGAFLNEASLYHALLNQATMKDASLERANLEKALMINASLQRAVLIDSNLRGASMDGASLQEASLDHASLEGASLVNAELQGTSFESANLDGAALDKAFASTANFNKTSMRGATLNNTVLQGAVLDEASLQGATLMNTAVWRTIGRSILGPTNIETVDNSKMDPEMYEKLAAQRLLNVVPELSAEDVKQSLSYVDPNLPDAQGLLLLDWPKEQKKMANFPNFRQQMLQIQTETACEANAAPYVAQGIVKSQFGTDQDGTLNDTDELPFIERLLTGCPGTVGMDQETINRLNGLKDELINRIEREGGIGTN
jgi:uncharacterized protein YjbI with pentapeptide repeats